jgi:hypothetical protein
MLARREGGRGRRFAPEFRRQIAAVGRGLRAEGRSWFKIGREIGLPAETVRRLCEAPDPEIWLDNNRTERGLRGPVIGRRNHFGSKSARGTVVAATMYSLVESAKAAGVDPIAYLIEVATRAKQNPGAVLLPADFKTAA